ncbi:MULTISPECIES: lipocalin family protein [unclassified Flavobacterium]|uniref:lipocalin family protein n=1 Tax=unclassified Flavobacterium TaxID=196869 RepID=UPI00131A8BF7|nr:MULTISPECIES: lipocalin family protein [unclassified Flavobacterium]
MKKTVCIIVAFLALVSCSQKVVPADLAKINGYWEVEKVVFDSIDDKEYRMNEVYDYFKIVKDKGIRKKVMPQLDGTFLVNDVEEKVAVRYEDNRVFIDYTTPYMKWSEEIIALTNEELVLLNKDKMEYHYKRATAINLMGDGKEIK